MNNQDFDQLHKGAVRGLVEYFDYQSKYSKDQSDDLEVSALVLGFLSD